MTEFGAALMLIGAALTLIAAVGLHRFDDAFSRLHAAGKASTLGFVFISAGAAVRLADGGSIALLVLASLLAILTIPAGIHLIGRSAWRTGTELADKTLIDDESRRTLG